MADYKSMYYRLAGRVADAVEALQIFQIAQKALEVELKKVQQEAEQMYLDAEETPVQLYPDSAENKIEPGE